MSKIFAALKHTYDPQGEAVASLMDQCAIPEPMNSGLPVAAGMAVEDEPAPAVSPAPAAKITPDPAAPAATLLVGKPDDIRVLSLQIGSPSPLLPFDETHWHAGEQYRMVRTRILQHPGQPRMILISSAGVGDGKSVSAINLAGALSLKADNKVLLVEGDFRRPTIHTQLGLPKGPGLTDVLKGTCTIEQALIRTAQFSNLYVITAGETTDNPTELLDSPRWRELSAQFRKMFGYCVIDSPPVGKVADYDLLQAACDGVVVIVRPDHTSRKQCFKALEKIAKQKLIGVVLNCVENWFLARPHQYQSDYYFAGK